MRILIADLSAIFWAVALGGGLRDPREAVQVVTGEIRAVSLGRQTWQQGAGYDRTVIACDGKGSFRRKLWPAYKADRPERPEHLWSLLAETARACEAAGWHVFHAPDSPDGPAEADDVIGTVTEYGVSRRWPVDILSGDSDLAQLVRDETETLPAVRLLRRYQGIQPLDVAGIIAWDKLQIEPARVADLKAIAGDAGDGYGNIFPGIGPKMARAALTPPCSTCVAGHVQLQCPECHGTGTARRTAVDVVEKAFAWVEGNKGANRGAEILYANGDGKRLLGIALQLARVVTTLPLDLDSLAGTHEPRAMPSFGAGLLPVEQAVENEDAEPPSGRPASPPPPLPDLAPAAAEVRGSAALVAVDASMRMLVPATEAYARMVEFRALIRKYLVPDTDYGRIPGCGDKPVLFAPGAAKLAEVYGLTPAFQIVKQIEAWEGDAFFYYQVSCSLTRKSDGLRIAESFGSCNSRETKYAGRWAYERQVPAHLDRAKFKTRTFTDRKKSPPEEVTQWRVPNEDIFDQVNTILKMAQKRAFVGAVLLATRSGGVFTQDAEDIPAQAYGSQFTEAQWES